MKTVNEELRSMSRKIEKLERENDSLKAEAGLLREGMNYIYKISAPLSAVGIIGHKAICDICKAIKGGE